MTPQNLKHNRLPFRLVRPKLSDDLSTYFLNESELRTAAACERMRVDRNGSVLSMILIRLSKEQSSDKDIAFLARVLEGRLRMTDTSGLLDDGRVAILLPDTPSEGAWKVAADISDVFPPGPERPECEVLVYPSNHHLWENEFVGETSAAEQSTPSPSRDTDGASFFVSSPPVWKRCIDVLGSLVGLTISAPVVALAALAVRCTSKGPVFFLQQREGLGGKEFMIYKLRTMVENAESLQDELRPDSHQDGPAFKMKRDPRTTLVGRFLRASSIDELPQFWNVLRGEMSLVGPRPLPTEESLACTNWQRRRLDVKPGMTCIWQVTGRSEVEFEQWMRMDLQYIKNQGIWPDIKLLLKTIPSIFWHKGIR